MNIFMIQDRNTKLYYKRGRSGGEWVKQEEASVWTTPSGPRAALSNITRYKRHWSTTTYKPHNWTLADPVIAILTTVPVVGKFLPSITVVRGDDWAGLYLNGKLVQEGHRVRTEDIFEHLDIQATYITPDQQWLEDRGSLPVDLNEVKHEH
jgi:hypothetical protein